MILCNALEDDEQPTSEQRAYARRALNRLVKSWSAKGLKTWVMNRLSITLESGKTKYSIGPTGSDLVTGHILDVSNATKTTESEETPITVSGRSEYFNQPAKTQTGETVFVFFDSKIENGDLYVWPAPSNSTDVINFDAKQYIEDFDNASDTPHFPVEWLDALIYNLALRLCPRYSVSPFDRESIALNAASTLIDAEESDDTGGDIYFTAGDYA